MEKLSPEIALDKYHEMWEAMQKAEEEFRTNGKDIDLYEFRMDFKKNWCKERGENPINNCYLCEYALQAYQESFGFDYSRVPSSRDYIMTKYMCRFCPVLWGEDRDNNNCEQDDMYWGFNPIDEILNLPVNTEVFLEYYKKH